MTPKVIPVTMIKSTLFDDSVVAVIVAMSACDIVSVEFMVAYVRAIG